MADDPTESGSSPSIKKDKWREFAEELARKSKASDEEAPVEGHQAASAPEAPKPTPPSPAHAHEPTPSELRTGRMDRRSHVERRRNLEAVGKNSRFGRDRRTNPVGRRQSDRERAKELGRPAKNS